MSEYRMTTWGEYWLRLRRAEATVLIHECEQIIEDNANIEAQLASAEERYSI